MNAYLIGNIFGRLFASYILTWVILFLFSRFDWRLSFQRSRKWYGLLLLVTIFLLGVAGGMSKGGLA